MGTCGFNWNSLITLCTSLIEFSAIVRRAIVLCFSANAIVRLVAKGPEQGEFLTR
jgi:hypothetical protein